MDQAPNTLPPQTEFVWKRLAEPFRLFGDKEYPGYFWLAILVPVLIAALVYAILMYRRDARTVGWLWASFLAFLRCTVYVILALMFLMPASREIERSVIRYKVVLLFDVSGSMDSEDDLPTEAVPVDQILSRKDKIVHLLTDNQLAFLKELEKNPLAIYRYGGDLDATPRTLDEGNVLSADYWNSWMPPQGKTAKEAPEKTGDKEEAKKTEEPKKTEPKKTEPKELTEEEKKVLQEKTLAAWNAFLKPNPDQTPPAGLSEEEKAKFYPEVLALVVKGTDTRKALLKAIQREVGNQPQAIIVIGDGHNIHSSEETLKEIDRYRTRVPIITVGVGEHHDPVKIEITEVLAPDQVQPDDQFRVTVDIDGIGLADNDVEVDLELHKPNSDKAPHTMKAVGRFKPSDQGAPPHAQVEFQIDPAKLPSDFQNTSASSKKPEMLEGKWTIVARVPKNKNERTKEKEHVSEKVFVQVIKKPLRVLLFAGAATRDYQFARTMFVREVEQKRAELSIHLQLAKPDIVQDVPAERLLKDFPSAIRDTKAPNEKPEDKYNNLLQYDVIIAFDPDWTLLNSEQLKALETWVSRHYGGLILIGGPVNTFQLTRGPNYEKLKPIIDMYPVLLEDNRVQVLNRDTSKPWRLNFPGATSEMEFLKLDDASKEPLSGWGDFFWGRDPKNAGREANPQRGFFDYYPVREAKPSATVVATFTDPRSHTKDGKEQPYLAIMPYGGGKTIYIGSGEIWRLRQHKEAFHERFWTKLCRFAGSASQSGEKSRGYIAMKDKFAANSFIRVEAKLLGRNMKPLPPTEKPQVRVTLVGAVPPDAPTAPITFELHAKMSKEEWDRLAAEPERREKEWEGWFAGRFHVSAPNPPGTKYLLELQIPGTNDVLPKKFEVYPLDPEKEDVKPDFAGLRRLASPAKEVLQYRLNDENQPELKEVRAKLESELERTNRPLIKSGASEDSAPTSAASNSSTSGSPAGSSDGDLRLFFDLKSVGLIPKLMTVKPQEQTTRGPITDMWDWAFWHTSFFGLFDPPEKVSLALVVIIGLFSIEWLTRKLLKLA